MKSASQALTTLIRFATEEIDSRPTDQQIKIYEALAELLPDPDGRLTAGRVAFSIGETARLQMDFMTTLNPNTGSPEN